MAGKRYTKFDDLNKTIIFLILSKSTLLFKELHDTKSKNLFRKSIIHWKAVLSKIDPEVYVFLKYCSNNPEKVTINSDRKLSYPEYYDSYEIKYGNFAFSVDDVDSYYVSFLTKTGWKKFESANNAWNAVAIMQMYCSLENLNNIQKKMDAMRDALEARNEYLEHFGETQ